MSDLLAIEFTTALVDELLQYAVPDVYADQRGDEDGNHDEQPERRPPWRAGDYPKVLWSANYSDQVPDAREDVVGGPFVDLEEATPRDLDLGAERDVRGGVGMSAEVDHQLEGSAREQ